MLYVKTMKPFYAKKEGHIAKLVFAYQHFSIVKDNEVFQFVPVEGKEIQVNLNTYQVENLSDVFVFQKGNRFIRLPLYQLLLVSDIHLHLQTLLQAEIEEIDTVLHDQAEEVITELEEQYKMRMIDYALESRNEQLFQQLLH